MDMEASTTLFPLNSTGLSCLGNVSTRSCPPRTSPAVDLGGGGRELHDGKGR